MQKSRVSLQGTVDHSYKATNCLFLSVSLDVSDLKYISNKAKGTLAPERGLNIVKYRTRAIKGCSRLVAAPLSFQAKTYFLCVFYVVIWTQK